MIEKNREKVHQEGTVIRKEKARQVQNTKGDSHPDLFLVEAGQEKDIQRNLDTKLRNIAEALVHLQEIKTEIKERNDIHLRGQGVLDEEIREAIKTGQIKIREEIKEDTVQMKIQKQKKVDRSLMIREDPKQDIKGGNHRIQGQEMRNQESQLKKTKGQ